jgi:POT family proton-dependent oligopeptide transporter
MNSITEKSINNLFKSKVLGHPSGLFVLFFTEMWERFSFYGMRVLLVNFLTMALIGYNPGWGWSAENAGALFGTYAMLLYVTPIIGGIIADKYIGHRAAVIIGASVMTLGHASMAFETEASLYIGLALLVIGTGFFKPTMTSIISDMYKKSPEKKDGAFTIYYMGVNAGAFFGMLLCGYLAEKVGWAYGFGLAGIFMLLGTIQFWLSKPLFGNIGASPKEIKADNDTNNESNDTSKSDDDAPNPFTVIDKVLILLSSLIGLGYAFNDPLSKIGNIDLFSFMQIGDLEGQYVAILIGLALFLFLTISRIVRYTRIIRDRMIAFIIFAFFTIFFWMSFEQGASSLIIVARDYIQRELTGGAALSFNIINAILTIVPLAIITYVLYLLAKQTGKKILASNITLIICFAGVWSVVLWTLYRDFNTGAYEIPYQVEKIAQTDASGKTLTNDDGEVIYSFRPVTDQTDIENSKNEILNKSTVIGVPFQDLKTGEEVKIIQENNAGNSFAIISGERLVQAKQNGIDLNTDNGIISTKISAVKADWVRIPASWFSILNSFFIIALASIISKWWDSKYNPSASMKYGLGLIIMAIGFGLLAIGSHGIADGVKISMIWLILAYLFHTIGELCLSPVGLSYVSKLVPGRMIAFMFGMWYLAIAIGNKLAAVAGGQIENIQKDYSLSAFFLIFTIVPAVAGTLVILSGPLLKKLMHGVK